MKQKALLIDWENFKFKIKQVLISNNKEVNYLSINYTKLFKQIFGDVVFEEIIVYMAKIKKHKDFEDKSMELIESQRILKTYLEKHNFIVLMCGVVRAHENNNVVSFKEKGVDVQIAVDIVKKSFSDKFSDIFIASSDSDINPAIKESNNLNVKTTYVGFQKQPNKGIMYTAKESILIRDSEILESINTN
jgi:uncharacterized LabA/DUF88 family protein